jgi:WD40 repeat protein/class 3 adenylate cyclase
MLRDETAGGPRATTVDAHVRTFLFADIRGYTVFTQEHGDEAAARLAAKFADIVRRCVEARDGTLLELQGDGAMCVFASPRQAIRASIELQRTFVEETVTTPTLPLPVGIGLDAGEAVPVEGGFRGGALNLGARLCGIAAPAEVLASRELVHLARKVEGVTFVARGTVQLKGLADPVQVIRLRAEAGDAADDLAFRRALGSSAARLTPSVPGEVTPNPYKGLRAFDEGDAEDFFGREDLVDELVGRVRATRFLAVVGPSGSGKSSVVRAGLIPALRRGAVDGSEDWSIVDMFPGAHPLEGLEAAMIRATPDPPPSLIEQLERDERGLHRAVLRLLPSDGSELVIVIDQFEEVFTLVEDEAVRNHFLGSLEAAATDPRSRLRIVITLRADFYDRPLLYRGFAELFKTRVEAVVPLSAEQLERAISGPAKRVDVSLEPGLVAAMLADVAEEPGALPLMEYALTELFDRRDGRMLTLASYREIGGVSGALGRRADELYGDLNDEAKEAARQLFLRLVALGEGSEDTRRRAARSEIASLDIDEKPMTTAIDAFGAARLLSFDRDAATGEPTIELAHEALLTAWAGLHRWIDAAREDLRTERRLAAAAKDWIDADRDPSFLLAGSRLEQGEAWQAGSGIAATPEEHAYIEASAEERERQGAEEAARAEHERDLERRSVRRLRAVIVVLAVASLVAGALTVFATGERDRAESEERTAVARELAAASVANLDVDPERSVLLALEAIDTTRQVDGSVLPEAEEAMHRAVTASRIVLTAPDAGGELDWSPDGTFVTEGPENSRMIEIRDASTGEIVRSWEGHDPDVNDVRFSPDGSMLATAGDDGALRIWNPASGEAISTVLGEGMVWGPSFDADGTLVAAAWPEEGTIRIVDPTTGAIVSTIPEPDFPFDTALSPDGAQVAVGMGSNPDGSVFDVATGSPVFDLTGHRYPINSVSWSPDGRWIATGANDSSVQVWEAQSERLEAKLVGHTGIVTTVDWARDSRRLVTGGSDGTARVWEIDDAEGREVLTLSAQQTRSGTYAAFSPDGRRVLTGDQAITAIKIWDVTLDGDAQVANLPTDELSPVDIAYLADGRIVAPSDQGAAKIWDLQEGPIATIGPGAGSDRGVWRIESSPNGGRIATVRVFSPILSVWDAETQEIAFEVDLRGEISAIDWSPDGSYLVASTFTERATVFDADGKQVAVLDEDGEILGVAFSADGRSIATAVTQPQNPAENRVVLWDWEAERVLGTIEPVGATAVAFDPRGSELAVARSDGRVDIHSLPGLERSRSFEAHSGPVNEIVYGPDGARIATAGEDATVRLFDTATGRQQLVLRGHTYLVTGIAFSPDGTNLASAAPDGLVRVWELDLDGLIEIARRNVTRGLSDDECRQYLHVESCP